MMFKQIEKGTWANVNNLNLQGRNVQIKKNTLNKLN